MIGKTNSQGIFMNESNCPYLVKLYTMTKKESKYLLYEGSYNAFDILK